MHHNYYIPNFLSVIFKLRIPKALFIMEQYKPFIKDLIKFYYEDLWNSTGGYFHLVLDDGNIEDGHVCFCQQEAEKNNDTFGIFLGQVLKMFTEDEREKMYEEDWWGMR